MSTDTTSPELKLLVRFLQKEREVAPLIKDDFRDYYAEVYSTDSEKVLALCSKKVEQDDYRGALRAVIDGIKAVSINASFDIRAYPVPESEERKRHYEDEILKLTKHGIELSREMRQKGIDSPSLGHPWFDEERGLLRYSKEFVEYLAMM